MVGRDNGDTDCCIHALLASQQKRALEEAAGQIAADSFGGPKRLDTIPEPKENEHEVELENRKDGHSTAHPDHERLDKIIDQKQAAPHEQKDDTDDFGESRVTHSRMLTKKELSDMAWGVREISKRLGSVKMKLKVQNVFLLTKAHDQSLIGNTREVAKWLLSPDRRVRYRVWVEDKLKDNKTFNTKGLIADMEKEYKQKDVPDEDSKGRPLQQRLRYWTNELCRTKPHTFDFVVTLGGDGTVLYASWLFQRIVPPVLSFALGSLGFLTKFDYDNFPETLTRAFRDGIRVSLRLRFEGTVMRAQKRRRKESEDGDIDEENAGRDLVEELVGEEQGDERTHKPEGTYEILNDIVVDRGPNPSKHML
jgi:NAD+ kinase